MLPAMSTGRARVLALPSVREGILAHLFEPGLSQPISSTSYQPRRRYSPAVATLQRDEDGSDADTPAPSWRRRTWATSQAARGDELGQRDPEPPPIRSLVGGDIRAPSLRLRVKDKPGSSSATRQTSRESNRNDTTPVTESSTSFQLPAPAPISQTPISKSRSITSSNRSPLQLPPPLPSIFVQHLQANPTALTPTIGQTLIAYADRHSDTRSSHKLKSLLTQYRVLPPHHPSMLKTNQSDIPAFTWQPTEPEYPHIDIVPTRQGRRGLPNYGPDHLELKKVWRAERNSWAEAMWPPLRRLLPRDPARDVVRHVHYLLLQAEVEGHGRGPFLETALGWLETRPEGDSQALAMLHLYLSRVPFASTGPDAQRLLEIFLDRHPDIRPTCQTLHLLVLAMTTMGPGRDPKATYDPADDESWSFKPTEDTASSSITPTQLLQVILTFRQRWNLPPQLETWRHIAKFALSTADRSLGQVAWQGWWSTQQSLALRRARRSSASVEEAVPADSSDSSDPSKHLKQSGEESEVEAEDVIEKDELGLLDSDHEAVMNLRFSHRGTATQRWLRVVRAFEKRGWVRHPEGRGDWDQSMWVGDPSA